MFPNQLDELKRLKQWVGYKLVWNEQRGKYSKLPIDPNTGQGAKANDPATWGTFGEALDAVNCFGLSGLGFEFANGYAGIDLDDVILENGQLKPFALEIVNLMSSYTEYSPSRKGLHILCKLTENLSSWGNRHRNDEIGLEMYDKERFFTITGDIYGEIKAIENRTNEARKIYAKYLVAEKNKISNTPHLRTSNEMFFSGLTDSELWQRIFDSRNGWQIRLLFNGDVSSYGGDHSRADQALCNHLAYWTNGDAFRMDRMFRQSGLMRSKWDERRGAQTYGNMTIAEALRTVQLYVPTFPALYHSTEKNLVNEKISDFFDSSEPVKRDNLLQYFDNSYEKDLERFGQFKDRKTGYANIDKWTSLYPGLYVLGAVSSLGKTTFAHQMADQLAKAGDYVLYFSLEQSELELATKGLSRLTALENLETAVSSIEIRKGKKSDSVVKAMTEYRKFASHETIIECGFDTTVDSITSEVKNYIEQTKIPPVVFIDYLQVIRPLDLRQPTKDAVDSHVRAFKKLSVDNNLVIFLISSFNRQNYLTVADFESFKESGGIEYTADVVWALQLRAMNALIFDTDKHLQLKRKFISEAKNKFPRQIELLGLKNRYGRSNTRYFFDYYAKYDLFVPYEKDVEEADTEILSEFMAFQRESSDNAGEKFSKRKRV